MFHPHTRTALRWLNDCVRSRPVLLNLRSSDALITIAVAAAIFTDSFLYTIVVPVIPTALRERVGLSEEDPEQRWTSVLLSLYAAALLLASCSHKQQAPLGYVADRMSSRRLPLLLGLLALAGSTALLCVGTTVGLWVAGRICQGLSAAVVWAVGFALLRDTISPEKFGRAGGILGMASSVGSMTGPLLGGVLYQRGGYYAVYGLAFGVIGVDVVFRFLLIEKRQAAKWLAASQLQPDLLDRSSAAVDGHSAESELEVIRQLQPSSESVPSVRTSGWRLTSLLLRSPRLGSVLGGYMVIALIGASFNTVLPLFVEETFAAPHAFDPLVGRIIDHNQRSSRYFAAGALMLSVPVYVLLRFVARNSIDQKVLLCALLALIGLSLAACLPPLMLEVSCELNHIEERDPSLFNKGGATAQAYGMLNSAWATGNLVRPYLAGYVKQSAGWGTVAWVLALVAGIAAVPLFLYLGGWIGRSIRAHSD
ncbi:major facilitator superfamily domain-containing protein [Aspergillus spectabilis]